MSKQLRRISYLRTFDRAQNPGVQAEVLQQAGCDPVDSHQTTANGPLDIRAAAGQLFNCLYTGDELIVYCLDRSGRDERSLVSIQQRLNGMGVTLVTANASKKNGGGHAD